MQIKLNIIQNHCEIIFNKKKQKSLLLIPQFFKTVIAVSPIFIHFNKNF